MLNLVLAQSIDNDFSGGIAGRIIMGIVIFYALFFIHLYIFRAVFRIPTFVRYQKAQIQLLEALAKQQGVDDKTVRTIISESIEWDSAAGQSVPQGKPA